MIHKLADNIATFFCCNEIIEQEDQEGCTYGLEIIISSIIGFLTIIITGAIFQSVWFAILYLILIVPLRTYTGGYHADTYLKCNVVFALVFAMVLGIHHIAVRYHGELILILLGAIFLIPICRYAPIENKNKPLQQSEIKKYQTIGITLSIIYMIGAVLMYIKNISYGILPSMVVSTVAILMMEVKIHERYKKRTM